MISIGYTKNTSICVQTDLKKMNDVSLRGPKKTPEMPFKVNSDLNCQVLKENKKHVQSIK